MDVAQVVAGHVLPQAAEAVAARGLDHLAVADRGRLLLAARGSGDPVDARVDHDLDGAAHRQPAPGQAEGIRPQRLEGSHAEDAAPAGRQAVRGLALPTRAQRRQSHAGAGRAGHGVAHRQDGGGHPAAVGHRQLDACALADVEPGRPDRPPDTEGEGPEPDHQHGDADEGGEADAQCVELQPAEQPADEHRPRAEAHDGPAGTGRHAATSRWARARWRGPPRPRLPG